MGNSGASFWYKGAIVQIVTEVLIIYSLIKLFGTRDSDIFIVVLLYIGVHLVLSMKRNFVRYISYKFLGGDVSENTFTELLSYEFPKPTKDDIEDPELYFDCVSEDESYNFNQRLFAATQSFMYKSNRTSGDFLALFQSKKILKKALLKYKNYIDSKERREAYSS